MLGAILARAKDGPEDVRAGAIVARAETIADLAWRESRQRSERLREFGEQCGSGGCHQLGRLVALSDGDLPFGKDLQRRGGGQRHAPVSAPHKTSALHHVGREDPRAAKELEGDARADDIDDGIDGAHLVKVNLVRGAIVNLAFGDGDPVKHGDGSGFHPVRKAAVGDQLSDLGVVAPMLMGGVSVPVVVFVRVGMGVRVS